MKSLLRGFGLGLLGLAVLGATGCQENNESVIDQQAKETAGVKVQETPPPASQADFGKGSQQNNPFAKGATGYPGTGSVKKQ